MSQFVTAPTVRQLIKELKSCDPDAQVVMEGMHYGPNPIGAVYERSVKDPKSGSFHSMSWNREPLKGYLPAVLLGRWRPK